MYFTIAFFSMTQTTTCGGRKKVFGLSNDYKQSLGLSDWKIYFNGNLTKNIEYLLNLNLRHFKTFKAFY